jgi:hypothetical protein
MILLPIEELKMLMAERPGWCISLFMPTHRSGGSINFERTGLGYCVI